MDSTIIYYTVGLLLLGVLVWYRTKDKPVTPQVAVTEVRDALDAAPQVAAAIEQLWTSGAIPKEKRLDEGIKRLGDLFPSLNEHQLRTAIEWGVWMLKNGFELLDEDDRLDNLVGMLNTLNGK